MWEVSNCNTSANVVTNLEDIIELILRPDPQVLDGHRTSSILSFAHIRKAAPPPKFTDMGVLWLNDMRGGQHLAGFADLIKQLR